MSIYDQNELLLRIIVSPMKPLLNKLSLNDFE